MKFNHYELWESVCGKNRKFFNDEEFLLLNDLISFSRPDQSNLAIADAIIKQKSNKKWNKI